MAIDGNLFQNTVLEFNQEISVENRQVKYALTSKTETGSYFCHLTIEYRALYHVFTLNFITMPNALALIGSFLTRRL